jgi:hypothetical protein
MLDDNDIARCLHLGLSHTLYLCVRASEVGVEQQPFIRAVGYLILAMLNRISAEKVYAAIHEALVTPGGIPYPEEIRLMVLNPVLGCLLQEVTDVCVMDCVRISSEPVTLDEREIKSYWNRLRSGLIDDEDSDEGRGILILERHEGICQVGFAVDAEKGCPLLRLDKDILSDDLLPTLKRVASFRSSQAKEN